MNLKDILGQTSITTLLLVFLFLCGTLYIISYWSTFEFDITTYIELFDIPKSFVFPLATGLGVAFLSLLAQGVLSIAATDENNAASLDTGRKTESRLLTRLRRLRSNALPLAMIIGCMLFYQPYNEWIVILVGLTVSVWGYKKLNNNQHIIKLIPYKRGRLFVSVLIAFIPVYSVCKGKLDSIAVWKNRHYFSVVDVVYTDESIKQEDVKGKKLIGKLGSCVIMTDSLNSNITVLNLERVEVIKYRLTKSPSLIQQRLR